MDAHPPFPLSLKEEETRAHVPRDHKPCDNRRLGHGKDVGTLGELKAPQRPGLGEQHKAEAAAGHGASEDTGRARPDRGSHGRLRRLLVWGGAASAGVRGA